MPPTATIPLPALQTSSAEPEQAIAVERVKPVAKDVSFKLDAPALTTPALRSLNMIKFLQAHFDIDALTALRNWAIDPTQGSVGEEGLSQLYWANDGVNQNRGALDRLFAKIKNEKEWAQFSGTQLANAVDKAIERHIMQDETAATVARSKAAPKPDWLRDHKIDASHPAATRPEANDDFMLQPTPAALRA